MKKYLIMLLFSSMLFFNINYNSLSREEKLINEFFEEKRECIDIKTINSMTNRSFLLIETIPSGYLIIDNKSNKLIEGNMDANSPYYNLEYQNIIYNGYKKYYYKLFDGIYDIYRETLIDEDIATEEAIWLDDRIDNNEIAYLTNSTYTYIDNKDYFSRTLQIPDNSTGTCGQVALAIILGYLDSYYNPYIVPDSVVEDNIAYPVTKKSDIANLSTLLNLDINNFSNYGTTNMLQNILLSYGHYIFNNSNGCPTTSLGLSEVFELYKREYIPTTYFYSFRTYVANVFENLSVLKNLIDNNIPLIMTMISYDYAYCEEGAIANGSFHNVVAYGYKNNVFVCHSGWDNYSNNNYRVLFSNIWLESYFAIEYLDEHIHTNNFLFECNGSSGTWCTCGEINCNHESTRIEDELNPQYHYVVCNGCNSYTATEYHMFNIINDVYVCDICGFCSNECIHYYVYNSYSVYNHRLRCILCSNIKTESHILVYKSGLYRCKKCPYSSSSGIGVLE